MFVQQRIRVATKGAMPPQSCKISHKKDDHQRQPHKFHVSRPSTPHGQWIHYCWLSSSSSSPAYLKRQMTCIDQFLLNFHDKGNCTVFCLRQILSYRNFIKGLTHDHYKTQIRTFWSPGKSTDCLKFLRWQIPVVKLKLSQKEEDYNASRVCLVMLGQLQMKIN